MANEYDKILRSNFREPKERLLKQLIPATIVSIRSVVPKLQQTILERETDTVAEAETEDGKRFIIHIEWQSSNDKKMASRMALYDLLLAQTYQLEVMGAVLYLGNDPLRMTDTYSFFGFSYQCKMIDVRLLDPELFLQSDDAGELIFAILTGTGGIEQKVAIAKRIMYKLHNLLAYDAPMLQTKLKQLEWLSLLRGEDIQQIIIEEERKMPSTLR